MATKPSSRQTLKSPDHEISLKELEQKLRCPSANGISKSAKANYRTKLLNTCQIDDKAPLTWIDLTSDDIQDLTSCPMQDLPGKVAAIFRFSQWETELQEAIWVSIYVNCLKFAKESDFSHAQISTFFSIYKASIERSMEMDMADVLSYFRTMIISHSGSVADDWDVFGPREAKLSIDFACSSLYQHFLSQEQELVEIVCVKSLELPVIQPVALAEAMSKSQYLLEAGLLNSSVDSAVSDADGSHNEENHHQNESETAQEENEITKEVIQENPLDVLSPEEIRKITSDTINSLFTSINKDYDTLFEDQKTRFMNQISKFVNN